MPIVIAPIGKEVRVIKILAKDKTKKHLASLGVTINSSICIISQCGGNVICLVKEGRLAIDKNLASKILVA